MYEYSDIDTKGIEKMTDQVTPVSDLEFRQSERVVAWFRPRYPASRQ